MFKKHILPFLVWAFYRTWCGTWRLVIIEPPEMKAALKNKSPLVFALWHGDELTLLYLTRYYKIATMVSTSKDGELLARISKWLGVEVSRGSSTRGAVSALKGIIRLSRAGRIPTVAVDGPKGPYHVVKPGILEVSRVLDASIVPAGVAAQRTFVFKKSWNKAHLPLPFSKVVVYWGKPLPPLARDADSREPSLALQLGQALDAAGQAAAKVMDTGQHGC